MGYDLVKPGQLELSTRINKVVPSYLRIGRKLALPISIYFYLNMSQILFVTIFRPNNYNLERRKSRMATGAWRRTGFVPYSPYPDPRGNIALGCIGCRVLLNTSRDYLIGESQERYHRVGMSMLCDCVSGECSSSPLATEPILCRGTYTGYWHGRQLSSLVRGVHQTVPRCSVSLIQVLPQIPVVYRKGLLADRKLYSLKSFKQSDERT